MKLQMISSAIALLLIAQGAPLGAQSRTVPQRTTPVISSPAPGPLSISEVIEGLYSLGVGRAEELVAKRGVKFKAEPGVIDILREFGASEKLLGLIPAPPPPRTVRFAGPLTVTCKPSDCVVIVNDKYFGPTQKGNRTITGLLPGEATLQVFSEGYEGATRKVQLLEDTPAESEFSFEPNPQIRQQMANQSLLNALRKLGGVDGMIVLGDLEGTGVLQWTDNQGEMHFWNMTFTRRMGKGLTMNFKTPGGRCTALITGLIAKQECKGKLKNSAEKASGQAATLFLKYQLQDVIQQLLGKNLVLSAAAGSRLVSSDEVGSYALTLDSNSLPTELVYSLARDEDSAVTVRYSSYLDLNQGRYPARIAISGVDRPLRWVFTMNSVRSRLVRTP